MIELDRKKKLIITVARLMPEEEFLARYNAANTVAPKETYLTALDAFCTFIYSAGEGWLDSLLGELGQLITNGSLTTPPKGKGKKAAEVAGWKLFGE